MTEATLSDLLKRAIDVYLADNLHTSLPGQITKYDASTGKAEVKPNLNKTYVDDVTLEMPIITNVPIVTLGGGNSSLNFPIQEGDNVLLIFCERSLERWLSLGGQVDPGNPRKFDISDCVAIAKVNPFSVIPKGTDKDVVLRYNNAQITINEDSKFAIGNSTGELFALLIDLITAIQGLTYGGNPLDPPGITALNTLIAKFTLLKGQKV